MLAKLQKNVQSLPGGVTEPYLLPEAPRAELYDAKTARGHVREKQVMIG